MSSSSLPPNSVAPRAKLRPRYLVVAMLVTWFVGVEGLTTGLHVATFLHHGTLPAVQAQGTSPRELAEMLTVAREVGRLQALSDMRDVAFPLAVAQTLLSGLLVVASGLAMGGRRGARSLALQAIAANLVFAAVAYALTTKAQSAGITSVAHAIASLSPAETRDLPLGLFTAWGERVRFVLFNVVTLLVGAFALTRERTKSFFAAVARATERAEEEP